MSERKQIVPSRAYKIVNIDKVCMPIPEASEITGISCYALRQGIKRGQIPYVRSGAKYLINMRLLLSLIDDLSMEGGEIGE